MVKNKKWFKIIVCLSATAVIIAVGVFGFSFKSEAATEGVYTYEVVDGEATITSCDKTVSGEIVIPSTLGGYPVKNIGNVAFGKCQNITSVVIPYGVTGIEDSAFWACMGMEKVEIPNSVTSVGARAFAGCISITELTIPESVTNVGVGAFACPNAKSLTLPASICHIANVCSGRFETITLTKGTGIMPDYEEYDEDGNIINSWRYTPWYGNRYVKKIIIEDGVTNIGNYTFYGCESLTETVIPDSVTSIGDYAFYGCKSLNKITIPDTITNIGDDAFGECDSLSGIWVDENNSNYSSDEYGVLFNKDKTTLIMYPKSSTQTNYDIPDSVININIQAFKSCKSLTSVTIPNGVTIIPYEAFANCSELEKIYLPNSVENVQPGAFAFCTKLSEINLPDAFNTINARAFEGCVSLEYIFIPRYVSYIGSSAFDDCSNLEIEVHSNNSRYSSDNYGVLFDKDKTELFQCRMGYKYYTVPNTVKTICPNAFKGCKNLLRITILENVEELYLSSFDNCVSLKEINVSENNQYYSSDKYGVLYNKDKTSLIKYPAGNPHLNYTVPEGVTLICEKSFFDCRSLKKILFPYSIEKIDCKAFTGCSNLTNVYYKSSSSDWAKVKIHYSTEDSSNEELKNATFRYWWSGGELDGTEVETTTTPTTTLEESTTKPTESTTVPEESTTKPEEVTTKPVESTTIPEESTTNPIEPTTTIEEFTTKPDESTTGKVEFEIRNPSVSKVDYGDKLILHADIKGNLPEGAKIIWVPDNNNFSISVSPDGKECTISPEVKGDTTFTVYVVDEEENVISEKDYQKITSNAGFFQKIIAFFKKIFGLNKTIKQSVTLALK